MRDGVLNCMYIIHNIQFQSHREQRLHRYREELDKAFQVLAFGRWQLGSGKWTLTACC